MKLFKKVVALLMVVTLVAAIPAFNVAFAQDADENLPIVFIGGRGTLLIDKDGNKIYPMSIDIKGCAEKVVPVLAKSSFTQDYDPFCDALYDAVAEEFKALPLDCNGNASNGSGTDFKWTRTTLSWSVRKNEPYRLYDYCFYYDWRLDPCEIADSLAQFIDDVLAVTGAPKVKIVGRCMGGNIVLAYLYEYGCEKVDRCLFYVSTVNGVATSGAGFSGDFLIDNDAITRFTQDFGLDPIFTLGDATLNELLGSAVNMLHKTYTLDLLMTQVQWVYDIVRDNVVQRLLLATFATFPSYWSMIGDDYYDAAKECTFGGKEEEFAEMIEKIDYYHYNIQTKAFDILRDMEKQGLDITVVCKYGAQQVPISKDGNLLSDGTVELYRTSFGATCTELDKTFDFAYLRNAQLRGAEKYISPDNQVDCSTCLFPDNTWVIKNCTHTDFPGCIDNLMMTIMRYPGRMNVTDDENYPQYMVYDKQANTLTKMTEDNCDTTQRWNQTYFEAVKSVSRILWFYIKQRLTTPAAPAE